MKVEIERKFVVNVGLLPSLKGVGYVDILQGYLDGEESDPEMRVRESTYDYAPEDPVYEFTMKGEGDLEREEIEREISPLRARALFAACTKRLRKRRHFLRINGVLWEVDRYTDRELVVAEVELVHARQELKLPDWIGREVTRDPAFKNRNLAR